MPVVSPPSVTALPTPPSTSNPANFDTRADAFLTALPTFQTETNAVAANVFANANDAATSAANAATQAGNATTNGAAQVTLAAAQVTLATTQAGNAATSATNASNSAIAAAANAGAAIWVSGTTYSIGDVRWSPASGRIYRRITGGAGTTDPASDGTNWKAVDNDPPVVVVSTASQTAVAFTHYVITGPACTVTLPAGPASGDTVWVTWTNSLTSNVIARNLQTIMGLSEDMTLDVASVSTVQLRFVNSSWRIM
jgi:hypothetical protein